MAGVSISWIEHIDIKSYFYQNWLVVWMLSSSLFVKFGKIILKFICKCKWPITHKISEKKQKAERLKY